MHSMHDLVGADGPCPQSSAPPTGYYVCADCGSVVPIKTHCHSWGCSADWRIAASRASKSLIERFADPAAAGNMQHWVLSPPADWFRSSDPVAMYEAVARLIRRDIPELAGVAIIHPYRVREQPSDIAVLRPRTVMRVTSRHLEGLGVDVEDVEFDAASVTESAEVYHGTWAALRERSDWRDYVYYSPHIHYIAAGYMLPKTQRRLRARGWVVKRVRRLRDADEMAGVMMYLWSHALYVGKKKKHYRVCIGRYWHLRRLRVESHDEFLHCPSCGGLMRRVDDDYHGWISDLPPAVVHRRCVIWSLQFRGC